MKFIISKIEDMVDMEIVQEIEKRDKMIEERN